MAKIHRIFLFALLLLVSGSTLRAADEIELSYLRDDFTETWHFNARGFPIKGKRVGHVSFWRPNIATPSDFYPFAHRVSQRGRTLDAGMPVGKDLNPGPFTSVFSAPQSMSLVWTDAGSGAPLNAFFYTPVAPSGYVSLGDVCFGTPWAQTLDINTVRCVRDGLVMEGSIGDVVYRSILTDDGDFSVWKIKAPKGAIDLGAYIVTPGLDKPTHRKVWCLKECAVKSTPAPSRTVLDDLIESHGPVIKMHPQEQYLPDDPKFLLNHPATTVQWMTVENDNRNEPDDPVFSETVLGSVPTSAATILEDARAALSHPQAGNDNFHYIVDYPESLQSGNMDRAKAYVRVQPYQGCQIELQFWIFYPWNGPGKALARTYQPVLPNQSLSIDPTGTMGRHYSDFELVRVRLSNKLFSNPGSYEMTSLVVSRHSFDEEVMAAGPHRDPDLALTGEHPVIYSAKDSHAHYFGTSDFNLYALVGGGGGGGFSFTLDTYDRTGDGGPQLETHLDSKYEIVSSAWPGIVSATPNWLYFGGLWGGFTPNFYTLSPLMDANLAAMGLFFDTDFPSLAQVEVGNGKPGLAGRNEWSLDPLLSPADTVLGGRLEGTTFNVGSVVDPPDYISGENVWLDDTRPELAVDGKGYPFSYNNAGKENTGILVTPAGGASVAKSITIWADVAGISQNPKSFELFGTLADPGTGPIDLDEFKLVASGDLDLPRGQVPLFGQSQLFCFNSRTVRFSNQEIYSSYLIVFPTLDDPVPDMRIAEIQLDGYFAPQPPSLPKALDTPGFAWTTTGDSTWFGQAAETHDGKSASQSGDISNNEESRLETTVAGPGQLSFWWKVSSEVNYDFLRMEVDGVEATTKISGEVDWQHVTVAIPSGPHTLSWIYSKDVSETEGGDAGWVDEVSFTGPFPLLSPTDIVYGGRLEGMQFNLGTPGRFVPGNNGWLASGEPGHAIDGGAPKYLNTGKENSGIVVTPAVGSSIPRNITIWTANDLPERDPASFALYGTHSDPGTGPFDLDQFTLIASGDLALPAARNPSGAPLDPENSQTVFFDNSVAYMSYMIVFPTLKNSGSANSMQIGEIQIGGNLGPNLGAGLVNYWNFDNNLTDHAGLVTNNASSIIDSGTFSGANGTDGIEFTPSGRFGSSIEQNGVTGNARNDGFVEIPRSADTLFGANATNPGSRNTVTISAWVETEDFDSAFQTVLSHGEGSQYRIARRGSGNVIGYAGGSPDIPEPASGPSIAPGTGWHHVVAISEGGVSTRLWVDGTLVATGTAPIIDDSRGGGSLNLNIGSNPNTGTQNREWSGRIDDVAMWNRALSPTEVETIYSGGLADLSLGDLTTPSRSFTSWAAVNIPPGEDPSFDGTIYSGLVPNGIRYAFDNAAIENPEPGVITAPADVPDDVVLILEHTEDLEAWAPAATWTNGVPVIANPTKVIIENGFVTDTSTSTKGFWRYRATLAQP